MNGKRVQKDLRRRLDRAAAQFADHEFVHAHTREGLFERLTPMTVDARRVLDLGTATGAAIKPLAARFPKASVVGLDMAYEMLAAQPRSWFRRPALVQADALALPFAEASFDVVYANLSLSFIDDLPRAAGEVARILRPEGLFVFACLGADSFGELRDAWAGLDENAHVASFPDMHDLGDALVRAGLGDPVLDVDRLEIQYRNRASLIRDLTAVGARNSLAGRAAGLAGRDKLKTFEERLFEDGATLGLELELVYGHAFGTAAPAPDGAVAIDAASIGRRRR